MIRSRKPALPPSHQAAAEVAILFRGYRPPHSRGWWRRRVTRMLAILGAHGELNVVFTDDEGIRKLNRSFRGIDSATDVLAFEGETPVPDGPKLLGDVVISGQTAEKSALRLAHEIEQELLHLLSHGLLHLLGYEHKRDSVEMRRAQCRLLKRVSSSSARGCQD